MDEEVELASRSYERTLIGSPAQELLRERDIWSETAENFHLGYVRDPYTGAHKKFQGMMSIPYLDGNLNYRGIRFRHLGDERPKYLSARSVTAHLFGVRYSDEAEVCITEGELDAMVLYQCGLRAVGVPGAQAWNPKTGEVWRWLFRNCRRVRLIIDNDPDGEVLASRIHHDLRDMVPDVQQVRPPAGMDVNDWWLTMDKSLGKWKAIEKFKKVIDESQ